MKRTRNQTKPGPATGLEELEKRLRRLAGELREIRRELKIARAKSLAGCTRHAQCAGDGVEYRDF